MQQYRIHRIDNVGLVVVNECARRRAEGNYDGAEMLQEADEGLVPTVSRVFDVVTNIRIHVLHNQMRDIFACGNLGLFTQHLTERGSKNE